MQIRWSHHLVQLFWKNPKTKQTIILPASLFTLSTQLIKLQLIIIHIIIYHWLDCQMFECCKWGHYSILSITLVEYIPTNEGYFYTGCCFCASWRGTARRSPLPRDLLHNGLKGAFTQGIVSSASGLVPKRAQLQRRRKLAQGPNSPNCRPPM